MKKYLFILLTMALISGCFKIPICGNNVCERGERELCPDDCNPIEPEMCKFKPGLDCVDFEINEDYIAFEIVNTMGYAIGLNDVTLTSFNCKAEVDTKLGNGESHHLVIPCKSAREGQRIAATTKIDFVNLETGMTHQIDGQIVGKVDQSNCGNRRMDDYEEGVDCGGVCSNACNHADMDLSDYPDMFIDDGKFDGLLVIGMQAPPADTIAVTNIAAGLQKAAETCKVICSESPVEEGHAEACFEECSVNPIPQTVNKFDDEISNPWAQNIISVGSPCNNRVTSELMGNPLNCDLLDYRESYMRLIENEGNYQLAVFGDTDKDIRHISRILENWDSYDLKGNEMTFLTGNSDCQTGDERPCMAGDCEGIQRCHIGDWSECMINESTCNPPECKSENDCVAYFDQCSCSYVCEPSIPGLQCDRACPAVAQIEPECYCNGGVCDEIWPAIEGDTFKIEAKTNFLEIREPIRLVHPYLDDDAMPNTLADGVIYDNFGETDNKVEYTQELYLGESYVDLVDFGDPEFALVSPKNENALEYHLTFDNAVQFDPAHVAADLVGVELKLAGKLYTIADAKVDSAGQLAKLVLFETPNTIGIYEGEEKIVSVDSVEHSIQMIDTAVGTESCGFRVDGSEIWVDLNNLDTINGVTIALVETILNEEDVTEDYCKIIVGATELAFKDGQEVEVNGDDVDGTNTLITSENGKWYSLAFTYGPDDTTYSQEGTQFVDPVLGNIYFEFDGFEDVEMEEIEIDNRVEVAFVSFNDMEGVPMKVPYYYNYDEGYIGLGRNSIDGEILMINDKCEAAQVNDCEGVRLWAPTKEVLRLLEIVDINVMGDKVEVSIEDAYSNTGLDTECVLDEVCRIETQFAGEIMLKFMQDSVEYLGHDVHSDMVRTENGAYLQFSPNRVTITSEEKQWSGDQDFIGFYLNASDNGIYVSEPFGMRMVGEDDMLGISDYGISVEYYPDHIEIGYPDSQVRPIVYVKS